MSEIYKAILSARAAAEIRQSTAKVAGDNVETIDVTDFGNGIKVVADKKGIRVVRDVKPTSNNILSSKTEKPVDFWDDVVKKNI